MRRAAGSAEDATYNTLHKLGGRRSVLVFVGVGLKHTLKDTLHQPSNWRLRSYLLNGGSGNRRKCPERRATGKARGGGCTVKAYRLISG